MLHFACLYHSLCYILRDSSSSFQFNYFWIVIIIVKKSGNKNWTHFSFGRHRNEKNRTVRRENTCNSFSLSFVHSEYEKDHHHFDFFFSPFLYLSWEWSFTVLFSSFPVILSSSPLYLSYFSSPLPHTSFSTILLWKKEWKMWDSQSDMMIWRELNIGKEFSISIFQRWNFIRRARKKDAWSGIIHINHESIFSLFKFWFLGLRSSSSRTSLSSFVFLISFPHFSQRQESWKSEREKYREIL